ncbi:Uncharacterised protein [uncultured archaeon]|nr:Uncharacterised protein [uncultured archaeon]
MQNLGKDISIGKSRVHEILASAGIFEREKKIEMTPKRLSRPEKPIASFSMDFTQKRIGNGDIGYVFGLLDMHNDAFVTLAGHPEKNGDIVAKNLEILKQIKPQGQEIEIRSDCGKEFYNESVTTYISTLFRKVVHGYKLSSKEVFELLRRNS